MIMANYERFYGTARSIFSFLEAISWLVTIAGIIALIAGVVELGSISSDKAYPFKSGAPIS